MTYAFSGYGNYADTLQFWSDQAGKLAGFKLDNPSFVISSGETVFAVSEKETSAAIYVFQKHNYSYRLTDTVEVPGSNLCHLCYSPKQKRLFGSCWGTGHLIYANVSDDGKLGHIHSIVQQSASLGQSRNHFCLLSSDESVCVSCNLGLDTLFVYDNTGKSLQEICQIPLPSGTGPRHAVFSKENQVLFVVTELSNEVLVLSWPSGELLQRIHTTDFNGVTNCSAICLTQDEKHLYVANRFSDTITTFSVGKDFHLSNPILTPCNGKNPRHMILENDDSVLLIAYQQSDMVSIVPFHSNRLPDFSNAKHILHLSAAGIAKIEN